MAFYTLGCKVNQYETSVLMDRFRQAGFQVVDPHQEAEVYVVNSCTVTAEGDRKSRQILRRFRRQSPGAVLCLCGCFPQAFPALAEQIPEADVIAGAKNREGLVDAVQRRLEGADRIVEIAPHQKGEPFEAMDAAQPSRTRAFVKIQDGCERYCAYCIIPTARGPIRSKPLADLRRELEGLAASGYQEVVLAGINLSSYGLDLGLGLLDAIRCACGIPGIGRVRLGSLEPELLTPGDIAAMGSLPGLCPQFHLSLQSGCDETLRRMRRQYGTAEYAAIVDNLRRAFPGCAITTDMMVGFPGETEEEFAASLAFAQRIAFAKVHVFAYSRRPGTLADRLPDQVDKGEKARRSKALIRATEETRRAYWRQQVGREAPVLVEKQAGDGGWEGYTPCYVPVRFPAEGRLDRQIHRVRITGVEEEFCRGEWVGPAG